METESPSTATSDQKAQKDYKPTGFETAEYEVIGNYTETYAFEPMALPVVGEEKLGFDPMFADFGGARSAGAKVRLHVSEHLRDPYERPRENAPEEPTCTVKLTDLENLKAEVYEEGRAFGESQATERHTAELQKLNTEFSTVFSDLSAQLKEITGKFEQQALELALNIAKKLLETTVEVNPEYITPIINEAIGQSGSAALKKIRVSPQDLEFIDVAGIRKSLKEFDGTWEFEADESIRSGCVLETSAGEIDYQLDKAWDKIKDKVIGARR